MPEAARVLSIAGFSDPLSSLTHLAGAAAFAVLSLVLLHRGRGEPWRMISLCVFAFSCVLLLSLSGVYHLLSPDTAGREVLKRLDHAAIFVLIAGSFTPVHVILLRGAWHWGMLAGICGAAIVGPHEIFHLAVLAGISCHWAFILGIATGEPVSAGGRS